MAHVGLISCVKKKQQRATPAKDLYTSDLFKKARKYVEQECDRWFILSAKHGLLAPDTKIAPYNETLNAKGSKERKEWAHKVWECLRQKLRPGDCVTILAGEKYRQYLLPLLEEHGYTAQMPMKGMKIGQQLRWLKQRTSNAPSSERDIERFYRSLCELEAAVGGKRVLSSCNGKMTWPSKGLYIFFEPGECRRDSAASRVVRVGTHCVSQGSRTKLWERLRAHRGTQAGHGNHRGSIFRLHVGLALSTKEPRHKVATWGHGQSAGPEVREKETRLEERVSAHMGRMPLLWLAIDDEAGPASDRAYLERNLIGLLTSQDGAADHPSPTWLGHHSAQERIQRSGLWNLDHLDYPYSPDCLDVLEQYVQITAGKIPAPTHSIAPQGWYDAERTEVGN